MMFRARIGRVLGLAATTVLGLFLPVLLIGAGPADAAFPGDNGKIAFDSNRDIGAGEIYAVTPGETADRITFSTTSSDPVYSPDGSRIAFVSANPGGTYQIFVMNADGSGRMPVTTANTAKQEPAWSPDGTKIAYVANSFDVDGQTDLEIWTVNADGSGRTQLTNNSAGVQDRQPAWSPLGDQIAFVRAGDVWVMNSDGSGATDITPDSPPGCAPSCYQGGDSDPAWSPTGAKIAYVHGNTIQGGGLSDVWTMDPNGANKVNVSNNDTTAFTLPAWSPDGAQIAMVGAVDTNRDIWVMDADGSPQAAIEPNPAHDKDPDWQPIPVCTQTGTTGNDVLTGTPDKDVICGGDGNDTLDGVGGDDILLGGAGNDVIKGSEGNDTMNGGEGVDRAKYASSEAAIDASLETGFATGQGFDVLLGIEKLTGSPFDDILVGSNAANALTGIGGDDKVRGGGASDAVVGGKGNDKLFGDAGKDTVKSRDGVNRNDSVDGGTGRDTCVTDAKERSIKSCP